MECNTVGDHVTFISFALSFPDFFYKNSNFLEFSLSFPRHFDNFTDFLIFPSFSLLSRFLATLKFLNDI